MNDDANWRYATKKFDTTKKIPAQEFDQLLEALRLAPSSCGLQPWKFIVIKNPELRKRLRAHSWDQPQITDADALIVFCSMKSMDENYVKNFVGVMAKTRGVSKESLLGYEQMMLGVINSKSPEALYQWMKDQVYISLGVLLNECAHRKIDACPMEGFNPQEFDAILELPKLGLQSVVLCTVGYRSSDDHYAHLKKVRFDRNEVFIDK